MSPLGSLWARSELRLSHSAPSLPKPLQLDPCSPPVADGRALVQAWELSRILCYVSLLMSLL